MKMKTLKHGLAGAIMLVAAVASIFLKPNEQMSDQRPISLEKLIPAQFTGWRIDESIVPVEVDPEVQAKLDKIYSQVLSRTYINSQGERVMLSVAYGGEQSDALKAHRPETCYGAQGFVLSRPVIDELVFAGSVTPVKRMTAIKSSRVEPLTYWIVVGDYVALSGFQQKKAQLMHGMKGVVADGLLVRVSSLDGDAAHGFSLQNQFLHDMYDSISGSQRSRIFGRYARSTIIDSSF
jgi:EpsI family protein